MLMTLRFVIVLFLVWSLFRNHGFAACFNLFFDQLLPFTILSVHVVTCNAYVGYGQAHCLNTLESMLLRYLTTRCKMLLCSQRLFVQPHPCRDRIAIVVLLTSY